jgi:putative membrane protein
MWLKAIFVIALTGMHGFYGRLRRDFAADRNTRSGKFYRAINEIPFVFAIIIVIAVIVKPF